MSGEDGTAGRVIGNRYQLLRVVGRGGMGVLWAAHDAVLQRDVAVKEIHPHNDLPPRLREQFVARALREARAAARIAHPSAISVYDVVEQDHRPWIVMELLSPRSLADDINDTGPLPAITAAKIGLEILDALDAAHRAGVLHGDVKPGNVLFRDGRAVLVDFGLAAVDIAPADDDEADVESYLPWTVTTKTLLIGSPGFMSPERARGEPLTPAGDLWSLGATLFAAVQGHPPFSRGNSLATLAAVITEEPPRARRAGTLAAALDGLLARDPAARPDIAHTRGLLLGAAHWPDHATPPRETARRWDLDEPTTPARLRPPVAPRRLVPAALVALAVTGLLAAATVALVLDRSGGTPTAIAAGGPPPTQAASPPPQTQVGRTPALAPRTTPREPRAHTSSRPSPQPSTRLTNYALTGQHTATHPASPNSTSHSPVARAVTVAHHGHRADNGHGKGNGHGND